MSRFRPKTQADANNLRTCCVRFQGRSLRNRSFGGIVARFAMLFSVESPPLDSDSGGRNDGYSKVSKRGPCAPTTGNSYALGFQGISLLTITPSRLAESIGAIMTSNNLTGKVQTVLGLVDPGQLGRTLTHEHILFDGSWVIDAVTKRQRPGLL